MPYISASIIMQLLVMTNPEWKKEKKENPDLINNKISSYTKYLAILIGFFQSFGICTILSSFGALDGSDTQAKVLSALVMTTGTFILIWLADRITQKGIGNGTSMIIFTGIVAEIPKDLMNLIKMNNDGIITSLEFLMLIGIFIAMVLFIIFFERSNRLVYIQYPRQVQQMASQAKNQLPSFMPLKTNPAGVIPPIFASSVLLLPATIGSLLKGSENKLFVFLNTHLVHGSNLFILLNIVLIVFFSYFYNNIAVSSKDISERLKQSNVFIPGIRPGESTMKFFDEIIAKLSLIGGIYLCIVCNVSEIFNSKFGYSFFLGGTSLLIVINVIVDTVVLIQSELLPQKYQKTIKRYK
jgi:preprotein translocase subunit SecY